MAMVMDDSEQEVMRLMSEWVGFAETMLQKNGEFFPYGAAMRADKSFVAVATDEEENQPDSQTVIDNLKSVFQEAAASGEFDATALFFDVRVKSPDGASSGDAVAVQLDHRDGISTVVYSPYTIRRSGLLRRRHIELGTPFSEAGSYSVFPKSS